jgi:hypothetical protein
MRIKDREKFQEAIRTKLVLEVAGLTPERRIVPAAEKEPRVPCLIGEKNWQERRGGERRDNHSEPPDEQICRPHYHDRSQRPRAGIGT